MRAALLVSAVLVASLGLTACTTESEPDADSRTETSDRPEKSKTDPGSKKTEEPDKPAPEPESDVQDLVVVNAGFGQNSYDASTWWYAAVINNPNPDRVFTFAEVVVEAIAADGTILDSSSSYVNLLPGDAAINGIFFELGDAVIDHLEIRGPLASDAEVAPDDGLGAFEVSELAGVSDEYSTSVSGILTSTFAEEQENVLIVIVASNPAGAIIGAEIAYVERLPVEGRVRFEGYFFDPLPADTTYAAYATP